MTRQFQPVWQRILEIGALVALTLLIAVSAHAADAGRVKVVNGNVHIERNGKVVPAKVGMVVRSSDTIVTGANSSIGVSFLDESMLSAGPDSVLTIDKYAFDPATNRGGFDSTLKRGTLAAVSGKLVKERPESMRIKTPAAIMGVRGTEFMVRVTDPKE